MHVCVCMSVCLSVCMYVCHASYLSNLSNMLSQFISRYLSMCVYCVFVGMQCMTCGGCAGDIGRGISRVGFCSELSFLTLVRSCLCSNRLGWFGMGRMQLLLLVQDGRLPGEGALAYVRELGPPMACVQKGGSSRGCSRPCMAAMAYVRFVILSKQ